MRSNAWTMLATLVSLARQPQHASAQPSDTASTKAELLAADRRLARDVAQRGSIAFLEALDTGAAVAIPWQPILRGSAEAAAPMRARYDAPASYRWIPVHAVAGIGGRFGCTVGVSAFVPAGDSAGPSRSGRYITCWRKSADRRWRIVGHQRSDSQSNPENLPYDTVPMSPAPHSATFAGSGVAREEVLDVESRYAAMGAAGPTGPAPAFAMYAADDAVLMPSARVAHGRREIEQLFAGWPPTLVLDWRPDQRFGDGEGGLAFTVGPSSTSERTGDRRVVRRGHFMTVWRQERDGSWRYIFDLGSPRPPDAGGR